MSREFRQCLGSDIPVPWVSGGPDSGGGNGDGGAGGGDRSMVDVLCSQRDRLRDRAARLEEGERSGLAAARISVVHLLCAQRHQLRDCAARLEEGECSGLGICQTLPHISCVRSETGCGSARLEEGPVPYI